MHILYFTCVIPVYVCGSGDLFFHVPKSLCFCWMLQPCFLDSFVFCAAFLWTFILAFRESSSSSNRFVSIFFLFGLVLIFSGAFRQGDFLTGGQPTTCRLLELAGAPAFICVVLAASFNPGWFLFFNFFTISLIEGRRGSSNVCCH